MCVFFLKEENKPISLEVYRNMKVKVVSTCLVFWTEVRFFALDKCVCPKLYHVRSDMFFNCY